MKVENLEQLYNACQNAFWITPLPNPIKYYGDSRVLSSLNVTCHGSQKGEKIILKQLLLGVKVFTMFSLVFYFIILLSIPFDNVYI
jgi:hypothetical protein